MNTAIFSKLKLFGTINGKKLNGKKITIIIENVIKKRNGPKTNKKKISEYENESRNIIFNE